MINENKSFNLVEEVCDFVVKNDIAYTSNGFLNKNLGYKYKISLY